MKTRKQEIKAQIVALREELGQLCIADKHRIQGEETVYHLVISPELILLRFTLGNTPSTAAYPAGITRLMRHYGLLQRDVSAIEIGYGTDNEMYAKAFAGETNPMTQDRWLAKFDLWDWTDTGPVLFAKREKS